MQALHADTKGVIIKSLAGWGLWWGGERGVVVAMANVVMVVVMMREVVMVVMVVVRVLKWFGSLTYKTVQLTLYLMMMMIMVMNVGGDDAHDNINNNFNK